MTEKVMNKKVEELVEWVAEQIKPLAKNYVLGYIHNLNELEPELKKALDCYTAQILSHPDLALIDDDQSYPDMYFWCPDCKKTQVNHMCNIVEGERWRKVIPLAEALKGANNDS